MDKSSMLIPSLPHHIAMMCLARLPRHSRAIACCVSQAWRNALNNSSRIASLRSSLNLPPEPSIFIGLLDTECDPGYLQAREENTQWLLLDPLSLRSHSLPNPLHGISVDIHLHCAAARGEIFLPEIPIFLQKTGFCCHDIPKEEGWLPIPFPPPVRGGQCRRVSCAEMGESIFMCGGLLDGTGKASRRACRYDIRTNQWETLPDMIMPRINCACVVLNGNVFAIGGYYSSGGFIEIHASGEIFDPQSGEWTLVPNLCANGLRYAEDSNVTEPALAVVEKKLYAMQSHSNEVMEFDPVKKQWTHFGFVGGDSKLECYSVNYKLLGVGSELWVIQFSMGEYICVFFCVPGRQSRASGSVKWRKFQVPALKLFDYVLTCTVMQM